MAPVGSTGVATVGGTGIAPVEANGCTNVVLVPIYYIINKILT